MFELLAEALHTDYGIEVECDDPETLRKRLYPLKRKHPEFELLSLVLAPNGKLWIVKRSGHAPDEVGAEAP